MNKSVNDFRMTDPGEHGQRKQDDNQNDSRHGDAEDILSSQAAEQEADKGGHAHRDTVGQLGHNMDHVVAGGAGGGDGGDPAPGVRALGVSSGKTKRGRSLPVRTPSLKKTLKKRKKHLQILKH